jgi:site-specific recombinase XerD
VKKPDFVHRIVRRGVEHFYFRKRGLPSATLPGPLGSPAFMAAYRRALAGKAAIARPAPGPKPPDADGTIGALITKYLEGFHFRRGLKPNTKQSYLSVLEDLRRDYGKDLIADLRGKHVKAIMDAKADAVAKDDPGNPHAGKAAANHVRKMFKALCSLALEEELIEVDPTLHVKKNRYKTRGHIPWEAEHVEQYRARHPLGTNARMILELLVNTAGRRSDCIKMGRGHIRPPGFISFITDKTGDYVPIPMMPEFIAALSAMGEAGPLDPFVKNKRGTAYSPGGFGPWFHDQVMAAGLPKGLSAHGVRKYSVIRLYEAGVSIETIAAWGGWSDTRTVLLYVREAKLRKLTQAAAGRLLDLTPPRPDLADPDPENKN